MRDLTSYRLSPRLVRAIKKSPNNQTALGFPFRLAQTQVPALVHGAPFGASVRERVVALGESLGVPANACTVRVRR